ncbi:PTS sugar transporter subunit IIA [Clostridium baratii]|uniref:PTS sugar transporter subunit IIA n=1 Tax=Clostridium baratii TaxID=1561 RepID=UPI001C012631|nr:fructose PTS transporter subunit IIA [Clostridium baratii]MBT9831481.1 PTS fructose transporter subunit IIA [Clostridium baratii]
MKLNELIKESTIKLNVTATDKNSIIDEMIDVLENDGIIRDRNKFKEDILKREALSNTGIGFGIAIPHAKSTEVNEPRIAVGIVKPGIDYGSIDGKDINMIFMIAVNDDQSDLHLKALANLSRRLIHEDFRNDLLNAESKEEILEMFSF